MGSPDGECDLQQHAGRHFRRTFTCSVRSRRAPFLSVQATDVAGNNATSTVNVSLQGPKLSITTPAALALFASSGITVSGTVDDLNAVVTVNGVSASSSGGTFTASGVVLREGANSITATGTNAGGAASTASVNVILDTTPPTCALIHQRSGCSDYATDYVTGLVNDVVSGTVNAGQVKVTINGVQATVGNRSFMAEDVLLVPGKNVITAVATDRAGNVNQSQITVTLQMLERSKGCCLFPAMLRAVRWFYLAQPLVVQAINSLGQAMPNAPVTFTVARVTASSLPSRNRAAKLPCRRTATGRPALVCSSARVWQRKQPGAGEFSWLHRRGHVLQALRWHGFQIHVSRVNRNGAPGQLLPESMIAIVLDAGGNPVAGVPVVFKVEQGGGLLENSVSATKVTDDDGALRQSFHWPRKKASTTTLSWLLLMD